MTSLPHGWLSPTGKSGLEHQVKLEVRDAKNSLCASCHQAGVEPGKAMPIPYTNACGGCHQADKL